MANDVSRFKLENDSAEYNFADAEARAAILDEIARAEAAEQTNATEITGEVTRAETAESALSNNIAAETTRAEGVEGALSNLTTTAKGNLVAAINELDGDVNSIASKFAVSNTTLTNRTTNGYGEVTLTGLNTTNAAVLGCNAVGGSNFYICIPFVFSGVWYIRILNNNGDRLANVNVGDVTVYYIAL